MDAIECLLKRRSVKKYKPDQIPEEILDQILECGTYAANGRGAQSAKMVVIQDRETIETLERMNADIMGAHGVHTFYGAPTVILVLADKTKGTYIEDGSLVLGNLMNAAWALGVDSCWIHRAKEEMESPEGQALLAKWGITGEYAGIGHCILGYADGPVPQAKPRKADYIVRV